MIPVWRPSSKSSARNLISARMASGRMVVETSSAASPPARTGCVPHTNQIATSAQIAERLGVIRLHSVLLGKRQKQLAQSPGHAQIPVRSQSGVISRANSFHNSRLPDQDSDSIVRVEAVSGKSIPCYPIRSSLFGSAELDKNSAKCA